ncbi:Fic family protein [Spirosoma litoris]
MAIYNWQQPDWPYFRFDPISLEKRALLFSQKVGKSAGQFELLPLETRQEILVDVMVNEAIKTSAIEGEFISRQDVISSIKRNLGLTSDTIRVNDKRSEGMAELLVLVRNTFHEPLSETMFFHWHTLLMKGSGDIEIGRWRTHAEPMQVVSGAMGKEKVHYEAPPSANVPTEMKRFIDWFNDTAPNQPRTIINPLVRASIAHLYFESIHPFEDGNGRIGRIIAEKALSQSLDQPVLLSLSRTIESNKKAYYEALQKSQRSNDITGWLNYFSGVIVASQDDFIGTLQFVLQKTRFFDTHKANLNERQRRVIARMFEEGAGGFEGGMNARKYIGISKVSKATATRDLQDLVDKQILIPAGGGRSSRYQLNLSIH